MHGKGSVGKGLFLACPYPLSGVTGVGRFTRDLKQALETQGMTVVVTAPSRAESETGEAVYNFHLRWKVFPSIELALLTAYVALRRRREFQVIHVQQIHIQSLVTMMVGRVLGRRSVLTLHVRVPNAAGVFRKIGQRLIERGCFSFSPAPVAVSPFVASDYGGRSVTVIENGVDTEHFRRTETTRARMRSRLGIGAEMVFIFSSRWASGKGFDLVAEALASRRLVNHSFRLLLLGDAAPDELEELRVRLQNLPNQNRILSIGPVPDVADYLSASDVFILPSRYEGMPLALLEAMANELPVILSDIPVHRLLVERAGAGWTFRSGDADDLALKIAIAVKDGLPPNWGLKLRQSVLKHNRFADMVQAYRSIYERLARPAE